ncbi:R3h domain containing protein [Thalictrum thalictroides]|uniref:R3h domain containing protein n=1 Tax=Thalictrum thalictroides TaxID=46969 RepID=A0A7J6XF96_THATH|nr:R3h domain containing protein [Thalictrum thalictroides]
MSMTQFAMVEELAFLIKDNLLCKHLILSVEEALVEFLENDNSPDGIMELQPMSPYNRLLVHRLADIFGFSHESVGEGDDRHLILGRCPDSTIPSILVSDILWQCNEYQSPATSHQLLRRRETLPAAKNSPKSFGTTLEEREAAYLAARERIFSVESVETKESVPPKPRNVPVVARRMIAHALGQKIHSNISSVKVNLPNSKESGEVRTEESSSKENNKHPNGSFKQEISSISSQKMRPSERIRAGPKVSNASSSASQGERKVQKKSLTNISSNGALQIESSGKVVSKDNLKQEHMGAAKRIFAHALGLQSYRE